MEGKVILETPSRVAVAPDGNGGLYAATRSLLSPGSSTTVISDLVKRKVLYVHAYCVDNCLVRVAGPVSLCYSIQNKPTVPPRSFPRQAQPSRSVWLPTEETSLAL